MDIKNLKEVVVAGCKGFEAYAQAKKDGKIDGSDLLYLIPLAQAMGPAVQDISLVPAEALDLSKPELAELVQTVMAECPELQGVGQALVRIEAVMNLLLAAKDCYLAFSVGKPSSLGLSGLNADMAAAAWKRAELLVKPKVMAEAAPAAKPEEKAPAAEVAESGPEGNPNQSV